jgi:SAM-dependent methyltransferase
VNGQVEFLVADLLKLPLADASVDVVLSGLTPLQDTVEAMREITRVLRPGGTLLVSLWGDDYAELRLLAEVRERLGLGSYPSGRRAAALERTRQAGLTIVATDDLVLPVRHASVEVYLNYRLSFGWAPWMVAERKEEYLRVLRERIEAWAQPDGSVALDWAITILTARRV